MSQRPVGLDVDNLSPEVLVELQAAAAGDEVTLFSSGRPVGVLQVRLHESTPPSGEPVAERPVVVATAMKLSGSARRRLSDELGDGYLVLDLTQAPSTADVLLTPVVSPQLLGGLRQQFPDARIVITEIEDEELGVSYAGPVSRLLDAGASAYLPPRALPQVAAGLHAHLTRQPQPALEADDRPDAGPAALTARRDRT